MEQKVPQRKSCPVCHSQDIVPLIRIDAMPVHCHLLWSDADAAQSVPRGDIVLQACRRCSHVFNAAFDAALMAYSQEYDNSLHFSPRFQQYATALAESLVSRYKLYGKHIVEIGSGQGDFLRMLCRLGGNTGIGFDPSYIGETEATEPGVTFVQDFYSEKYAEHAGDFTCCRHVLEHIEEPDAFVAMLQRSLNHQDGAVVFFEVPNVIYTLKSLGIWDIIYEHFSYFSADSLSHLFRGNGFVTLDVTSTFGGQFLTIEAQFKGNKVSSEVFDGTGTNGVGLEATAFAMHYQEKVATWKQRLVELRDAEQRVVLWGAGSKGVTFLNIVQAADVIQYVVDINPRKQGKFVTGTGQQIVAPRYLSDYRPDVVIILNPNYREEISRSLAELGLGPEILLA